MDRFLLEGGKINTEYSASGNKCNKNICSEVFSFIFFLFCNGSDLNSEATSCSPAPLWLTRASGRPLWFTAPTWTWLNLSGQENRHISSGSLLLNSFSSSSCSYFFLLLFFPSSVPSILFFLNSLFLIPPFLLRHPDSLIPVITRFFLIPAELLSVTLDYALFFPFQYDISSFFSQETVSFCLGFNALLSSTLWSSWSFPS